MTDEPTDVRDDATASRFIVEVEGVEAELFYWKRNGQLILIHTEVPKELGGRGIGGRLINAAVDSARAGNLTIIPWCPFARRWLAGHSNEAENVSIDWDTMPSTDDG